MCMTKMYSLYLHSNEQWLTSVGIVLNLLLCSYIVSRQVDLLVQKTYKFFGHGPVVYIFFRRSSRRRCSLVSQDPRQDNRSPHDAGRVELDIYGDHGYDRLEHVTARPLSKALPTGPARSELVPEFPVSGTNNAFLRLHSDQFARITADLSASDVERLGSSPRPEPGSAAWDLERRRALSASPVFRGTTDGVPGVAAARFGGARAPGTTAHRAAGALEPGAQDARVGTVGQVPRPGPVGRQFGALSGDLPVRAEVAAELRQGAQAALGLHLGEDPGRRQRKLFFLCLHRTG